MLTRIGGGAGGDAERRMAATLLKIVEILRALSARGLGRGRAREKPTKAYKSLQKPTERGGRAGGNVDAARHPPSSAWRIFWASSARRYGLTSSAPNSDGGRSPLALRGKPEVSSTLRSGRSARAARASS